jgi:hypothetical protein
MDRSDKSHLAENNLEQTFIMTQKEVQKHTQVLYKLNSFVMFKIRIKDFTFIYELFLAVFAAFFRLEDLEDIALFSSTC